jgi:hypothetical protein
MHYFREVRNICVEGRVEKTRWSHIPITFSEEDERLQGFPHNDALVIEANIESWTLGKLWLTMVRQLILFSPMLSTRWG